MDFCDEASAVAAKNGMTEEILKQQL